MYKHEDSLGVQIINNQSYLQNVTLHAREVEVDQYTYNCLNDLLGKGQVIELEKQKVVLNLVRIADMYDLTFLFVLL